MSCKLFILPQEEVERQGLIEHWHRYKGHWKEKCLLKILRYYTKVGLKYKLINRIKHILISSYFIMINKEIKYKKVKQISVKQLIILLWFFVFAYVL